MYCYGTYQCIFCYGIKGGYNLIFNKKSTDERINEIIENLETLNFDIKYVNSFQLKTEDWIKTPKDKYREINPVINKKCFDYIKSLPEYDEEIFNKIFG